MGGEEGWLLCLLHTNLALGALPGPPSFFLEQGSCGDLVAATVCPSSKAPLWVTRCLWETPPLTQQPACPGWWNGMQPHSLLPNIH